MKEVVITTYPRLYTSLQEGPSAIINSKGDIAVDLLYEMMVDRRYSHTSWQFQQHVLQAAIRLFGDFQTWISAQRANPQVIGRNLAFIEDTLAYIEGGDRELCLANWMELVSQGHADIHITDLNIHSFGSRLQQSPSTVKALQKWCSRPNGLEDLLGTLHLLFGRARP